MGPAGFQDKALERQSQFASWRACKVAEPGEARQPAALWASGATAEGGQLGSGRLKWVLLDQCLHAASKRPCILQGSPGDPPLPRSR